MARWGTPSTTARRPPLGFPFRAGRWVDAAGTKDGHGNGETVEDRSAEPVIADEKMSEIAGVELVHLMVEASFTKSSWRCPTDFAEGGRSERDLRNERGGSHHTGYRRGTAHCKEHASPVSEITRCHEAQAAAAAGIQPFDKLRRIPTPGTSTGGCRGTGKLRGAAPGAQGPGLCRRLFHPEVLRVAQPATPATWCHCELPGSLTR